MSAEICTGSKIGNYVIEQQIGEGGMGVVYGARHEQLNRRAAIKVLHTQLARDKQVAARFVNEARAANALSHPGLVNVFEVGQLQSGSAYIVMEYLDGESLANRLARRGGRLGADALRFCRQLASTLSAVHKSGVVHRDLKPDNVMLVPDPEMLGGERAKILDFGIAKIAADCQSMAAGHNPKTRTGTLLGTPQYMAPEQCRGTAGIDGRADVYSLGVMLFEMLVGAPPFQAAGVGELIAMHMYQPAPSLLGVAPWVSPALASLIDRMLIKDVAQRPVMAEVAAELEILAPLGAEAFSAAPLAGDRPSLVGRSQPGVQRPLSLHRNPSHGHGQLQTQNVPTVQLSRRGLMFSSVLAVAALLGCLIWLQQSRTAPQYVNWFIESDPAGARVIRSGSNDVLGVTPWHERRVASAGHESILLRLKGHAEKRLELPLQADAHRHERLEAQAPAKAPVREIQWTVRSEPSAAAVVRKDNGQLLGHTPWQSTQPAESGFTSLILRSRGYQERLVELARDRDTDRLERLQKQPKKEKQEDVFEVY
jgi:serine/threonine protein kinase